MTLNLTSLKFRESSLKIVPRRFTPRNFFFVLFIYYIDPKSNEDKVTEVIDELTKIHSTVTRGDDDGNEYIIIKRNSHMKMSNTTNSIKGDFDDTCDPVVAAKQLAEIVDNIL